MRLDFEAPTTPYKLDVIPLTEGLDFNTATSLSKPSSLRDCLNYEFVDGAGLHRIKGFRQYDGNDRSVHDKIFFLRIASGNIYSADAIYATSPWLYVESNDNPNKVPFGYILWKTTTLPNIPLTEISQTTIIPFIRLDCPDYADPVNPNAVIKTLNSAVFSTTGSTYEIVTADALTAAEKAAVMGAASDFFVDTEEEFLQDIDRHQPVNYISCAASTTENIFGLDGVWAERLNGITYQIADAVQIEGSTNGLQIYAGDYVYFGSSSTVPFLCLKAELLTGNWTSGTAKLHIVSLAEYVETSTTSNSTKSKNKTYGGNATHIYGTTLYMYRHATAALTTCTGPSLTDDTTVSSKADVACMYTMYGETASLTAGNVRSIESEDATQGSGYDLSAIPYTASSGNAEAMPLIAGGAVKAVIPTKMGDSYTGDITFTHSGGGAATTPIDARVRTIDRVKPRFHHTGWKVNFDAGDRSYGYLNKIDRYKDIDGNSYSASSSVTSLEPNRLIGRITSSAPGVTSWPAPNASAGSRWDNFGLWRNQAGATLESTLLENIDTASDSEYIYQKIGQTGAGNYNTQTNTITLSSFPGLSDIPEGSSIKGIKVTAIVDDGGTTTTIPASLGLYATLGIVRQNETGGFVEKAYGSAQEFFTAGGNNLQAEITGGMASTTFTAGGTTSLFGAVGIPIEEILDPDFSVGLFIQADNYSSATAFEVRIDHVYIDVYYELPSVRYYFADSAKNIVLHGDLVDYIVSSGSFEAGDAEGTMTVVNLRTTKAETNLSAGDSTTAYYTVLDNYDIYQDSGLTVKVGVVNGDMEFNGFDSYKTIKQAGSRYVSERANFYANDDYEAFYICSGAGRAGIWDSKYWSRIYAISPKQGNSADLDKPRHVGVHNFHLFLGYRSGQILFSAPGDPSNFSAFDGAGEIGIGDKIHGFNRLQGNAFGVFCEESVHAVTGTDVGNFSTQVIVPKSGVLEYSVASFGSRILFINKTGIATLDQTEKYGNFIPRPLSFDVGPWLVPRVNGGLGLFTTITDFSPVFEAGNGFVCAYPAPHHNQYRVWFADGLQLWMTMVGDDSPKFTFIRYFSGSKTRFSGTLQPEPMVPMYVSVSGNVSSNPRTLCLFDRDLMFKSRLDSGIGTHTMQSGLYVLDAGDGFESGQNTPVGIPHYALINYQYLKNPFTVKTLRKVRLEGQTRGAAPLAVYTEDAYKKTAQDVRTTGTNISLPRVLDQDISLSYIPESTLANVAATGRVLSILIVGEALSKDAYFTTTGTDSLTSTRTTIPTPSHYLQALLVQFEEGQEDA